MLEYAFKELKKKYDYVVISTLVDNSANVFYAKLGGKIIGTSKFILDEKEYLENVYIFDL